MGKLYVIQDSYGRFLSRQDEWVEGGSRETLFRSEHRDLALNTLIELNTRDVDLRATVVTVDCDDQGRPLTADLPPPQLPGVATGGQPPEAVTAGADDGDDEVDDGGAQTA